MTIRNTFSALFAGSSSRPQTRPLLESLEPRVLFSGTLTAEAGPDLTADEGSAITVDGSFVDTNTGTPGTFDLLTLPSSSTVRTDFTAHSISGDNVIWYDTGGNVYVFDGTTDGGGNPNIVDLTALTGGSISTSGYSVDAEGDRVVFNSASKGVYVYTVSTGVVQQIGSGGSSITNVQINDHYVTWQKSSGSFLKTFIYDLSDPLAAEQLLVESADLGGAGSTTGATVADGVAYWIGAGGAGGFTDVFAKDLASGTIFNVSNTATHSDHLINADGGVVGWNAQTPVPVAYVFDGRGFDGTGTAPTPIVLEGFAGGSTSRPSISGANVAFESSLSSRNRDIFVYNLDTATTTNITNDGSVNSEQFAFIQGSSVVWENTVGATSDVVLYDLDTATEIEINTDGVRDYKPLLSGGNASYVSGGSVVFARGQGDATYQFDWDFGDGTILSDATLSESHIYADDGVYTVTLTVTSSNGDVSTDTALVTVNNAAPVITGLALDSTSVDEGGAVTLTGSFTDAGVLDTHTVSIAWGDGTTSNAVVDQAAGTFEATHTYLDDTAGAIDVTLADDDGGSDVASESIAVTNVAPVITGLALNNTSVDEGGLVTLTGSFADAGGLDTHTVSVAWGDGTTSSAVVDQATGTFEAVHTYLDDASAVIDVTLVDDDGDNDSGTVSVTVNNVGPSITGLALDTASVDEGGAVTLTGTFTDAGVLDTHTVSVTWGDGSTSNAVVDQVAGTFEATHTYLDDNPTGTASDLAAIGVTLTDDDAGSDTGNESVVVNNLAPVVATVSGPDQAVRGQTLSYIGSFTDAGTLDTHTEAWTVTDNSSGAVIATGTGPSFDFVPDTLGDFTVTYTVTDDDTGTGDSSAAVSTSLTLVTADPIDPSQTTLFIGGSNGSDFIRVGGRSTGLKTWIYDGDGNYAVESGIQADRIVIYGNDGGDFIKVYNSAGDRPADIFGGAGNDWIRGGQGDDTIVGGDGNDFIGGHGGRDLLIGGEGSDFVVGHRQDDILIAGSYTGQDDLASLRSVMALWTSTDSYTDRVASLSSLLDETTVLDDDSFDLLLGLQGQDYFMYNDCQDWTDQRRNELMTDTQNDFLDSEAEEEA
ncbi:MAG: PKD domain-containing protein [Phycisphaeraceae bacterium]|nr:PKD domain-containing protein [Phycisphaeraceae bacterium]